MPSQLTRAHILGQARLRRAAAGAIERIWYSLPGHDRANVDEFLSRALPLVEGGQRQSVALTEAYLARFLRRQALGVNPADIIASIRGATTPAEAYERPFVTLWTKLGEGTAFADASASAAARASNMATFDIQAAMRETADAVDQADTDIYGYQRVADPAACAFCQEVDGAYVKGSEGLVMALHNGCGCGLEPLTEPHRGAVQLADGTEVRPYQYGPLNENVAVYQHGELGPVLGSPDHDFTEL